MILATLILTLIPTICIDNHEALLRERNPRPAVVLVIGAGIVQRVEGFTYLTQIRRLSSDLARYERASVAVQIAIQRNPFKRAGELADYIAGAAALVDTPVLVTLRTVPRISLEEAVNRYLYANSPDVRKEYGEILHLVAENRANACSFWR
jgi:hypothetical protein